MITNKQIKIEKIIPFDANFVEKKFTEMQIEVLRWAVVDITDTEYVIDAAIIE